MSDPRITLGAIDAIIDKCKHGIRGDCWSVLTMASIYSPNEKDVTHWIDCKAYTQAAIALLPDGAVWRKYTDRSVSVYGASPFNAQAQERFDGLSLEGVDALMICAAYLEMIAAPLRKRVAALEKAGA